jgi:DNA-binding winged helix-turn-helix (wHTH) protein
MKMTIRNSLISDLVQGDHRSELRPKGAKLRPRGRSVSANSSSRIIRFSTFEVNLHTGELRQRGQKVRLQEQPLHVLAALLERPGEMVTREELRSKLWPADTFVDFDHSLNAAIRRLRDALGESAETPIFVETVARRGYRFIGNVELSAATPSARPRPRQWRSTTRYAVLGGLTNLCSCAVFSVLQPFAQIQSRSTDCNSRRHQRWRKI